MSTLTRTELREMQGLAQEVTVARPELLNAETTVGELAWEWSKDVEELGSAWRHHLWHDDAGRLVGFGWACLPYTRPWGDGTVRESNDAFLRWLVHPDRPELFNEVLDWFDDVADGLDRLVITQSADDAAQPIVAEHGYELDEEDAGDEGDWIQFNRRPLDDVPEPVLADGYRFVTAEDVSAEFAVEAHRGAWDGSPMDVATLERVQSTWPYRPDQHVLVEGPDGAPAASAIVWLDEASAAAQFEPVGTHRDHRRKGIGSALQLQGMRTAAGAGARTMFVACLGAPAHPAARAMYEGVGFRPITRDLPQVKAAG